MRPPKFNFIPEDQLIQEQKKESKFFVASIYPNGSIHFNKNYVDVYELNQKFVEFYVDKEKRTIGWRFLEGTTELDTLNKGRQLNMTPKGVVSTMIKPLLTSVGWTKGTKYKKMLIEVYKSQTMSGEIHYIQLPDLYLS